MQPRIARKPVADALAVEHAAFEPGWQDPAPIIPISAARMDLLRQDARGDGYGVEPGCTVAIVGAGPIGLSRHLRLI
jgi:threonine dehydrogenase-like Zn-dependent dehydrogenase